MGAAKAGAQTSSANYRILQRPANCPIHYTLGYPFLMSSDLQYRSRAVRALVRLHEEHLRGFVHTWRIALANSLKLPESRDTNYSSLETLGRHVLSAAGGYMIWACGVLGLPDPGIRAAPDESAIVRDADEYLEHVLERWRAPLSEVPDEKLETPEYQSEWATRYSIDAMLEHAVMHPIRHSFQLNELLKSR
jgi:hypothetical protein